MFKSASQRSADPRPSIRRFPPARLLPLCAALLASGQVMAITVTGSINGSTTNVNNATLTVQSSAVGLGYLTLWSGSSAACGSAAQIQAGQGGGGIPALRSGSLPFPSAGTASYTFSNLSAGTAYTACFAAYDGVSFQDTPATVNLTTAVLPAAGEAWSAVGGVGFSGGAASYSSLSFSPDGTPHVAFRDNANSNMLTVMKYSGGAWSAVGGAGVSAGTATNISSAFAPDGTLYVGFQDGGNGGKATVMKYSGGAWSVVGSAGFSAGNTDLTSLGIAPDGTPYLAYTNVGGDSKAIVMKYSGGSWAAVGGGGLSAGPAFSLSLSFALDGTPYVAYSDHANAAKVTVMQYSGGAWSAVGGAHVSASSGTFLSLAFSPDGTPHVAYRDIANGNKATVMKYSGGAWSVLGGAGFSSGANIYNALSFAPDGTAYLAYSDSSDGSKTMVRKFSGGAWSVVGSAGFSGGAASHISSAFAPDGTPHIAYMDVANSQKATLMKFTGPGVPATPSVTAAAGDQSQAATLTFATPADGGAALSGYTVTVTPSGGSATTLSISGVTVDSTITSGGITATVTGVSGGNTVITLSGLTNRTTYAVTLAAVNRAGNSGASTSPVGGITPFSPPTVTVAASAGLATLTLQSPDTGSGYFTLLSGAGVACGSPAQIKAGQDSGGAAAFRYGSLPLSADTAAVYTVRNLTAGSAYTACFTGDDGATLLTKTATTDFTSAAMASPGSNWAAVGTGGVSPGVTAYVKLEFAPDGVPYLAYLDLSNGNKASVLKYTAGAWSAVGSAAFTPGAAGYLAMAFAPDGAPHVAFRDFSSASKATVMKFSGGNWSTVGGAGFSAGGVGDVALSFAPDGTPYVAFKDAASSDKATVMKYSGGAWSAVGGAGFSDGGAGALSLAFAPDGAPYLAFKDAANGNKATVMKYSGGAWSAVGGAGLSASTVWQPTLSFAPDGTPHVAYRDDGNGIKATLMKYSGGAWSAVGGVGFTTGRANYPSLAFAPDGTPYVAVQDNDNTLKATVMKFSGGVWSVAGNAGLSAGQASSLALSFSPDGVPYLAYTDSGVGDKAMVMKLGLGVPGAPADAVATAGPGSASVAFTAPVDSGGAAISEYTASCAPANAFSSISWTASASGAASPITVSGLTAGTAYKCAVKAKNSQGYGSYSSASVSVTPTEAAAAPATPSASSSSGSAPQTTSLPSGGNTAAPSGGQTVVVTDNGANGSMITLPSGIGDTGAIKVALPGGNSVNVNKDTTTLSEARVSVTQVTLPGSSKPVTAVTLESGKANFTATQSGQPVAGLKNGIVVVSGSSTSQVTLDTTGSAARIGVSSADTIVVPSGAPNVSGTVVDLPQPKLNGETTPVTVKAGDSTVTVQATQADTRMTFQVIDIGGVKTPVLSVSGAAQVGASGDNQPLVSLNGNVITSGSSSGGQQCNTIIQASSSNTQDVVHVVTCYIVLPVGSFSAQGNRFAAIKDGIVWAGETAEFDKNGNVTGAYLGTRSGVSGEVGDDLTPGGNKFAASYTGNAFIPRLAGKPLRLNGADLNESLFKALNQTLGTTTNPAIPVQSAQGVLSFQISGDSTADRKAQSVLTFNLNGDQVSVIPTRRIRVDTSRADGVSVSSEGNVEVAAGGLVTNFAPSVGDPQVFAASVAQALPGAISELRWNGAWKVTTSDGAGYIGRPAWNRQAQANGATFASLANGNVLYNDGSYSQMLVADFHDYTTLQSIFAKDLNDPTLKVMLRMDGTAQATVNGNIYTLAPQWNLVKLTDSAGKPTWWAENGVIYIKNADGTAQGFTVQ